MNRIKKWLKIRCADRLLWFNGDGGGITFIEVIVTFVMLVAAVVITVQSLFFGDRMLGIDMHKQQVQRIVQQEMEYWIGRFYTHQRPIDPTEEEMLGKKGYKLVYLDDVPGSGNEAIEVSLSYDQILERYDYNLVSEEGQPIVSFYVITVWADWMEPDGQELTVSLTTYAQRPN